MKRRHPSWQASDCSIPLRVLALLIVYWQSSGSEILSSLLMAQENEGIYHPGLSGQLAHLSEVDVVKGDETNIRRTFVARGCKSTRSTGPRLPWLVVRISI